MSSGTQGDLFTLSFPEKPNQALSEAEKAFRDFHRSHPEVFETLSGLAFQALDRGYNRMSVKQLWEITRWGDELGSDIALNNNYHSRYARLLMRTHPELRGVFEVRELRSA